MSIQNSNIENAQSTEMFMLSAENFEDKKFYVVRFHGTEALNELFNFSIDFVCTNKSLDTDFLMSCLTTFSIIRKNGETSTFTGYPINVEQSGHFGDYAYYHIDLRPTFWKMTQLSCSRIFLNKNIKDIIKDIITDEQWLYFPNEFNFIRQDYPQPEFVMQYNETNFDFICWNLEQNGAYFYFDQDTNDPKNIKDKIIFCDYPSSHASLNKDGQTAKLSYAEVSGLDFHRREEIIFSFKLKQSPLPKNIVVRDYDWKKPNRVIIGNADVSNNGLGTIYLSNENVESEADANRIAKIRAEELQCHSKTYYGKSVIPALRPGFTFELTNHYNQRFNQEYLLTKVTHEGCQESFLTFGLGIPMQEFKKFSLDVVENNQTTQQNHNQNHYYYYNNFECIQAGQVYRPKRTAPRAEIKGVIRGFIDGAGDASRPEVDEFGRYKVVFPFDISGREKGKASCWIRRSQEQVGKGSGLNFPLSGGVEVTISFINGNPNLPIISGALANGESQSLAKNTNTNTEGIFTAGGSSLLFSNTDKKQGFALQTAAGRGLSFGAGSLTTSQMNTDYAMSCVNAVSTNIHGLASTNIAGMKKMNVVSSLPSSKNFSGTFKFGWFPFIIKSISKTAQEIMSAVSKKMAGDGFARASSNIDIGSAAVKAIEPVISQIPYWLMGKKTGDYSATLSTTQGFTMSKLEAIAHSKKDVIAWLVTSIATTLIKGATEITKDATGITKSDKVKAAETKFAQIGGGRSYGEVNDEYQAARKKKQDLETSEKGKAYAKAQRKQKEAKIKLEEAQIKQKFAQKAYDIAKKDADNNPDNKAKQEILANKKAALDKANAELEKQKTAYDTSVKELQTAKAAYDAYIKEEEQKYTFNGKKVVGNKTFDEYLEAKKQLYDLQKVIRSSKQAMAIKYVNSTLTELLPELVALCLTIRDSSSLENKRLGGIQLNSADANISLSARDPISLHTARGVLVNTEDLDIDKACLSTAENAKTFRSSDGDYSKWGIADENGKLAGDYEEGSLAFEEDPNNGAIPNTPATLTGFLQNSIKYFSNLMAVSLNYGYGKTEEKLKNGQIMKKRFIANQTEHIINVAKYGTDLFKGQKYSVAYSYTFVTKALSSATKQSNLTFLRMSTKGDNAIFKVDDAQAYQPSKTGFIVDVFGAAANDHSITLRAHSEATASIDNANNYKKPSSWLNLSKNVAELSVAKNDNQKQIIKATDKYILIGVTDKNEPNIKVPNLKNGLFVNDIDTSLRGGDSRVVLSNDDIYINTNSPKNQVQIENVAIQNDTITVKKLKTPDKSGVIDIGGVIKIIGANYNKLKDLNKEIKKHDKKLEDHDEKIKEFDEKIKYEDDDLK